MKMRTLRRLAQQAPRHVRRRRPSNVTSEPDPGPAPEAVFEQMTGPYGGRGAIWQGDEET